MGGDVEMNHPTLVVGEHHEDKEDSERYGWYYEEVGRNQLCDVMVEEGAPSLRWRLPSVHHVLGHSRLGKREPKFGQLAVHSRCAPKRICQVHLSDQVLNMLRNLGAPKPQASALPPPVEAKSRAMPTDHRFWFEDGEGGASARPEVQQTNPKEAISSGQGQSLPTALQHGDLMAQGKILRLQRQPGSEARPQGM